jgi:hypothetical protein
MPLIAANYESGLLTVIDFVPTTPQSGYYGFYGSYLGYCPDGNMILSYNISQSNPRFHVRGFVNGVLELIDKYQMDKTTEPLDQR